MANAALPSIEIEPWLRCARCDYDLRGAALGGNCSECGLPVSESRAFAAALLDPGSERSRSFERLLCLMAVLLGLIGASLNARIELGTGALQSPILQGLAYYGGSLIRCLLLLGGLVCLRRLRIVAGGAAAFSAAGAKQELTLPWIVVGFVVFHLFSVGLDYCWWMLGSRRVYSMLGAARSSVAAMLYLNRVLWPVALGAIIAMALGVSRRIGAIRRWEDFPWRRGLAWVFVWTPIAISAAFGLWLFAEASVGRTFWRALGTWSVGDSLVTVSISYCVAVLALCGWRMHVGAAASVGATDTSGAKEPIQALRVLSALRLFLCSMGIVIGMGLVLSIRPEADSRIWVRASELLSMVTAGAILASLVLLLFRVGRAAGTKPITRNDFVDAAALLWLGVLVLTLGYVATVLNVVANGSMVGFGWAGVVFLLLGSRSALLGCACQTGAARGKLRRGRSDMAIAAAAMLGGIAFVQARALEFVSAMLNLASVSQTWLVPMKAVCEGIVFVPALLAIGGLLIELGRVRRDIGAEIAGRAAAKPISVS